MPRFFYDVDDRGRRVVDKLGMLQVDVVQAIREVVPILEWLAADSRFEDRLGIISVTVRSQKGKRVYEAQAVFEPPEP